MAGLRFTEAELSAIDVSHRLEGVTRCPVDAKPLLITAWPDRTLKMVYFVCRQCTRIGAIAYPYDRPDAPGIIARQSGSSSRPPPT